MVAAEVGAARFATAGETAVFVSGADDDDDDDDEVCDEDGGVCADVGRLKEKEKVGAAVVVVVVSVVGAGVFVSFLSGDDEFCGGGEAVVGVSILCTTVGPAARLRPDVKSGRLVNPACAGLIAVLVCRHFGGRFGEYAGGATGRLTLGAFKPFLA